MAANDQDHPVREMFPGISVPAGTGAQGSAARHAVACPFGRG